MDTTAGQRAAGLEAAAGVSTPASLSRQVEQEGEAEDT
jgi:hypothetical protein